MFYSPKRNFNARTVQRTLEEFDSIKKKITRTIQQISEEFNGILLQIPQDISRCQNSSTRFGKVQLHVYWSLSVWKRRDRGTSRRRLCAGRGSLGVSGVLWGSCRGIMGDIRSRRTTHSWTRESRTGVREGPGGVDGICSFEHEHDSPRFRCRTRSIWAFREFGPSFASNILYRE